MHARPDPPPAGADIWHIGLDVDTDTVDVVAALLDADERRRAGDLRDPVAAHRFVVAHGAARTVLARYLGAPGDAVHWARGPNGKPFFEGQWSRWQWSLSRSGGHALLAVRWTGPVGVDLERVRDGPPTVALATRFLPAEEAAAVARHSDPHARSAAYHRLLSRKEACVKASGGRFLEGLRLRVLMPGTVEGTGPLAGQRWLLRDLPAPPGYVAALATTGDRLGRLRLFEWGWPPERWREGAAVLPGQPPGGDRAGPYRSEHVSPVPSRGPRGIR
ncbi:4'-phosphopantetheinyl transferase [Micromonospora nigra]|uniref:4'-phosphopantetheinyl transferase n=1 Tax=Micromonospora nigra TaxID=145857 RepID=A0A1C6T106_9ACTN|nr:4'-phosphopantetheinyl transferase superfamily protein [Micromonospora nigra]SCL35035.1 4'-phosphopantetheinyl transferase [Micromonospora nigra]